MPSETNLLRDIVPFIGVISLFIRYVLSPAIRDIRGTAETSIKARTDIATQPLDVLKTQLEIASRERGAKDELIAIELIGLRAAILSMQDDIQTLFTYLKEHLK